MQQSMRSSIVILSFCSLFLAGCSRESSSGASAFQMRLVEDCPTAETEPMTMDISLSDPTNPTAETLHVRKEILVDSSAVASAEVRSQALLSQAPVVEVIFTDEGRKAFADVTRQNIGRRLGIVVAGKLIMAPRIEAEVSEGIAQISGRMTTAQATELAEVVNAGVKR